MSAQKFSKFRDDRLALPSRQRKDAPLALDLFAGCGGLALGLECAGFGTEGVEMNEAAAETYRENLHGSCKTAELSVGFEYPRDVAVVVGGPPCQPFSVGGLQAGPRDSRDGFPIFLDAVERLNPKVALFENVRGMLFRNRRYFDQILEELRTLGYTVGWRILDAWEFGAPQHRERLIVVASKVAWEWPIPLAARERFTAGDAVADLACVVPPNAKFLTASMDAYVERYERASKCKTPRDLHLDRPSRTLTCRNLNGATGDMMRVRLPDGRRRRVTVGEAARLQSFPDWYRFCGSEGDAFNQIGNSVAPLFAFALGSSLMSAYSGKCSRQELTEESLFPV